MKQALPRCSGAPVGAKAVTTNEPLAVCAVSAAAIGALASTANDTTRNIHRRICMTSVLSEPEVRKPEDRQSKPALCALIWLMRRAVTRPTAMRHV
jgi:hypothetical protein